MRNCNKCKNDKRNLCTLCVFDLLLKASDKQVEEYCNRTAGVAPSNDTNLYIYSNGGNIINKATRDCSNVHITASQSRSYRSSLNPTNLQY